jgi:RNA polymerase sigma-54 factor
MKLSLQLKLGQQLTMTPQLQQAIRLLQLSTLDLQQEIHQALESNPMLELDESNEDEDASINKQANGDLQEKIELQSLQQGTENHTADEPTWQELIPGDLAVDSNWDDIHPSSYSSTPSFDSDFNDFESRNTAVDTLQDHLLWQLNLTPMTEQDNSIALAIIDAIDANGMLTVDIESIYTGFDRTLEIEQDEVIAVLHRIQQFDPVGVGYRDLAECLLIQMNQFDNPKLAKQIQNAKLIIKEHLSLLGHRDYAQLMRRTRLKEAELQESISLIESLNPRPGANISPPSTTYIVPDVIVSKQPDTGKCMLGKTSRFK